uniref:Ig-like domain-containing protein n=1 Tax=Cyclopterus lumpus TaxID=8103 RepID=A0A8C2WU39_CYCLU
ICTVISRGDVLLPCTCLDLDEEFKFKWQMEEPNLMLMYMYNKSSNRYTGRTQIFQTEKGNNCSVLLTNITAEDQGRYKCIFRSLARYSVCQTKDSLSGGVKVFQCNVTGRYREARIQWTLHGQPLTDLTKTKITHTNNTVNGLYHFNSTLSTKLNWTSEPTCDVKANHISTTLSSGCRIALTFSPLLLHNKCIMVLLVNTATIIKQHIVKTPSKSVVADEFTEDTRREYQQPLNITNPDVTE